MKKTYSLFRLSTVALASTILMTSCSKAAADNEAAKEDTAKQIAEQLLADQAAPAAENKVAIRITNKADKSVIEIMSAEIDAEIDRMCAAQGVTREQVAQFLPQARQQIRQRLIMMNIVQTAAAKSKIEITDADRKDFMKQAFGSEDITIEQAAKTVNMPVEEVRSVIEKSIQSNKFISTATNNLPEITLDMAKARWAELEAKQPGFANTPETVSASHILVKVDKNADEAVVAEAKKTLEGIRQKIVDGADFAEMAKQNSACPSGEAKGGDLGEFGRGMMVPEFEKAAFEQELDVVGPVIRTDFGFHIIKVTKKTPAIMRSLDQEETREQFFTAMKREAEQKAVMDFLQKLHEAVDVEILEAEVASAPMAMPVQAPAAPTEEEQPLPAWAE